MRTDMREGIYIYIERERERETETFDGLYGGRPAKALNRDDFQ